MEKIIKEFRFRDFVEAMGFVQKVALIAERQVHHPDILIRYNVVTIESYTHDTASITEKDHRLMAAIQKSLE